MRLCEMSITRLSIMLRENKCSAAEINADVQARIKEKQLNAYITLSADTAEIAENADNSFAVNWDQHPLMGIPIAVKDNISTKGMLTTCGSRMLSNYVPFYDATVIEKLKHAGAVITGKTNMDEFAMGCASDTSIFGSVKNPINADFSAGGSSGGSAAAVASGQAIAALGSDTGGSVRQPASFCGVVGFKPTYGTVSRYGLIAFASSLDQIGTITRNVYDASLLYNTICDRDRRDSTSVSARSISLPKCSALKGLKIGLPSEMMTDEISAEVKKTVNDAIIEMEKAGAVIKPISVRSLKYAVSAYYIISSAEAASNLGRFDGIRYGYRAKDCGSLKEMYERTRSEGFGLEVKRRILLGNFVLSEGYYDSYYKRAVSTVELLKREISEAFKNVDVMVSPVYPEPPFRLNKVRSKTEQYTADICTVPASLTGCPAISVPFGCSADGMPIGIQLMAERFNDQKLLSAAYAFEQMIGGGVDE